MTATNADRCTLCVTTTNLNLTDKEYYQNGPSCPRNALGRAQQLCNTSIPVYLLASLNKGAGGGIIGTLRMALSNFIYRKWFQPYKTEIEFDRSLFQFIRTIDMQCTETRPPASTFDILTSLNKDIRTHIEETKNTAIRMIYENLKTSSNVGLTGIQEENEERQKWARMNRGYTSQFMVDRYTKANSQQPTAQVRASIFLPIRWPTFDSGRHQQHSCATLIRSSKQAHTTGSRFVGMGKWATQLNSLACNPLRHSFQGRSMIIRVSVCLYHQRS